MQKITKGLSAIETERSSMADTSQDAARLDQEREGLDTTLSDIHAKLSEMESDKAESRAASILAGLGFSPERQQYATKTFSGGWRMRLALARALFCEPDLLLLDGTSVFAFVNKGIMLTFLEPSNMLDVPSITFLSNYLQTYPSTVFVVSHDRAFLNEIATDIVHQHSERLDYYKGANFGKSLSVLIQLQSLLTPWRIFLCHQGRAQEEREARIREADDRESTFTRLVNHT